MHLTLQLITCSFELQTPSVVTHWQAVFCLTFKKQEVSLNHLSGANFKQAFSVHCRHGTWMQLQVWKVSGDLSMLFLHNTSCPKPQMRQNLCDSSMKLFIPAGFCFCTSWQGLWELASGIWREIRTDMLLALLLRKISSSYWGAQGFLRSRLWGDGLAHASYGKFGLAITTSDCKPPDIKRTGT